MDSTAQIVLDIHRHSRWANGKLLDAAEHLAPEQLRTPIGEGGYGDLLETLLHMYDAQKTWLDRARIGESGPSPEIADYPDIPLAEDFQRLRSDPEAWADYQSEIALWDTTLMDGLEHEPPWEE